MERLRWRRWWLLAALLQTSLIVGGGWARFHFDSASFSAGPPIGDLYAWNWEFQEFVFLFFHLPILLFVAAALVAAEFVIAMHYFENSLND